MSPKVESLDHLVLSVGDIDRAAAFYVDVLGMKHQTFRAADGTERHAICFGGQKINLHRAGAEFQPHAQNPAPGSSDLCFLSQTPISDWCEHLSRLQVSIEDGPVERSGATGRILSVYLRDPDGNLIEVSNTVG